MFALAGSLFAAAKSAEDRASQRAAADQLFNHSAVLRLRLEIPKAGMESLRKKPREYVAATLREDDAAYEQVAVHLKGSIGSFRNLDDKPGLTLNLTKLGGTNRFHGLKKFHLNNSVQDGTCLSEYICGEMFRQAGVPASRATLAVVEINGRKLGLFVLLESMDKDFLARHFKQTSGNLYGQAGNGDITEPIERMEGDGPLDRADLKALAAAAREPDLGRRWEQLQQALDVDRFLSFMALEAMLCHWDGYTFARHNYRVYQDVAAGRMVFLPHDLDQLLQNANAPVINLGANGVVAQALLKIPEARGRYQSRLFALHTNVFVLATLTNRVSQRVAQVVPALAAYDQSLARSFQGRAEEFKSRLVNRARVLARQLEVPTPVVFENQVARLSGWRQELSKGQARFAKVTVNDRLALHIKSASSDCIASWRTTVSLAPGRYRFSGQARCAGVVPAEGGAGGGGGLRNHLNRRANKIIGDQDWTSLAQEFQVRPDNPLTMLVCDLRALKGEIWFDPATLKLEKLD